MDVTIEYGGVRTTKVLKVDSLKDCEIYVNDVDKTLRITAKKMSEKCFKLAFFSLHSSHLAFGKISFRFHKQDTQLAISGDAAEAKEIFKQVVATQGINRPLTAPYRPDLKATANKPRSASTDSTRSRINYPAPKKKENEIQKRHLERTESSSAFNETDNLSAAVRSQFAIPSHPMSSRTMQSYSELRRPTPQKKRLNSFASPHRLSPSRRLSERLRDDPIDTYAQTPMRPVKSFTTPIQRREITFAALTPVNTRPTSRQDPRLDSHLESQPVSPFSPRSPQFTHKAKEVKSPVVVGASEMVNSPKIQKFPDLSMNRLTASGLSSQQRMIVDHVMQGQSVFFTGGAGTGKSFLLKKIINLLKLASTAVTASTGLAACHLNGVTLHHWGGIGLGTNPETSVLISRIRKNQAALDRWLTTKTLIIDEISMVDGNFFDKLETVARGIRGNSRPWGGLQLIVCGDFLQLPPVGATEAESSTKFCFEAKSWTKSVHRTVLLDMAFRQATDSRFAAVLNEVREGQCSSQTAETLGARIASSSTATEGTTRLLSLRKDVEAINIAQLDSLSGKQYEFIATDTVHESDFKLDNNCPAKRCLTLKVGCQVLLLKTISVTDKLVNGSIGTVVRFSTSPAIPIVRFHMANREFPVQADEWIFSTGGQEVARRQQIPLDLAWGISIHKSQGMTLDRCEVSLDGIFEAGQAYVAMSRCRSLNGLSLVSRNINKFNLHKVIKADPKCIAFYQSIKENV